MLNGYPPEYALFEELTMARLESRLPKLFERISQYDLLILAYIIHRGCR